MLNLILISFSILIDYKVVHHYNIQSKDKFEFNDIYRKFTGEYLEERLKGLYLFLPKIVKPIPKSVNEKQLHKVFKLIKF